MAAKGSKAASKAAGETQVVAKHPGGRPTLYRPEICQEIIEFFSVRAYEEERDNSGRAVCVPNRFPTLAGFAAKLGVSRECLHEWKRVYPEFSDAFNQAKDLQEQNLVEGTMAGAYQQSFAIFAAKNILGWRDSKDLTIAGDQDKPLLTKSIVIEGVSTRV